jgi:hypothetical protein
MNNDFLFEGSFYGKVLSKLGIGGDSMNVQLARVLFFLVICWLPLALITLFQGNFWTGSLSGSFISSFDTQTRFLVSLPIFILAEKIISPKLALTLNQFISSGIVRKEEVSTFHRIIDKRSAFLRSTRTDLVVLVICYIQTVFVIFYQKDYTSLLSWQTHLDDGVTRLNTAGIWSTLVSRPLLLFLFYRWLLRIIVWGVILKKIASLDLDLYAIHPDQCGGLGFLGYSIRNFSPIAFAISATVAGNMADLVLSGQTHIINLRMPAALYLIFILMLFTLPLMSFAGKLIYARERTIHDIYNYTNGIYRELRKKIAKGYEKVTDEDLSSPYFSTVADMNAVVGDALKIKFLPFTIKDLVPLVVTTAVPFLFVILLELPLAELIKRVMNLVV